MDEANTLTQSQKLDFLIDALKKESAEYGDLKIPAAYREKRMLFRSLMNVRPPAPIAPNVLRVQDEFLQTEAKEKGVMTLADIPTVQAQFGSARAYAEKLSIWQGDITRLAVGAIVNAANSALLGCFIPCHGCIDNAIHSSAGMELREVCNALMKKRRAEFGNQYEAPTACAEITGAFNLPAQCVVHTVGPIVYGRLTSALCDDLANCYKNVLDCARSHDIRSVAFCCISTGEFHFPNDKAAEIAVNITTEYFTKYADTFDRVIFNVFKDEDRAIYERLLA